MIKECLIEALQNQESKQVTSETDKPLSIKEASEFLNLAPQTIYGFTSKNLIPFKKRGKKLYFSKSDLVAWLHEGKRKTISEIEKIADDFSSKL